MIAIFLAVFGLLLYLAYTRDFPPDRLPTPLIEKCPQCGCSIEPDFILCPDCHSTLKKPCSVCGRLLKTSWDVCPYCGTKSSNDSA